MVKGEVTLNTKTVLKYYWQNGLLHDLFGILPLNLCLGSVSISGYHEIWIALLRGARIVSAWKCLVLFGQFEIFLKRHNVIMHIIKAILLLYFLWHWTACLWFFINSQIEKEGALSWIEYHGLRTRPLKEQYLMSFYMVMNVVSSVGYGDMFAMNDLERLYIVFMINLGDALFALAFGLIAAISMHMSQSDEVQQFIKRMGQIDEFMTSFGIEEAQKKRVEQYFAYAYHQKTNSDMIVWADLLGYLPYCLLKEVIYYSSRDLLSPMFSQFRSENLIRELASALDNVIFLPGDYIIYKDDIGEEMYFIVEGKVFIIAADKHTVLNTLSTGRFFGEIAIFLETKRISYVQAETFCIISILRKADLDRIILSFPRVADEFKREAERRVKETRELEKNTVKSQNESSQNDTDLHEIYGTPDTS